MQSSKEGHIFPFYAFQIEGYHLHAMNLTEYLDKPLLQQALRADTEQLQALKTVAHTRALIIPGQMPCMVTFSRLILVH